MTMASIKIIFSRIYPDGFGYTTQEIVGNVFAKVCENYTHEKIISIIHRKTDHKVNEKEYDEAGYKMYICEWEWEENSN